MFLLVKKHRRSLKRSNLSILPHHSYLKARYEGCTSYVQPLDTALNKTFKNKISELLDREMDRDPIKWNDLEKFCVGDRRILITHCVGEAWNWLHEEKKDMIIRSFPHVGLTLNVDGSEESEIRVKDVPNLEVGNWTEGGIECNLNRQGKTSDGLIELNAEDDQMFDNSMGQNLFEDSEDEGEGEYVLETGFQTKRVAEDGAIRVSEQEINTTSLEDYGAATCAIMDIDFLCTDN